MNILSFAYNQKFTILFYFIIILQLLFMYFFIYLFIYLLYATPEIVSEIKVFTFTLLYSIRSINIKEPLLSDSKGQPVLENLFYFARRYLNLRPIARSLSESIGLFQKRSTKLSSVKQCRTSVASFQSIACKKLT